MSQILIIDTSTEACSVALQFNGSILERYQVAPRQHGELVLPMVDELLKEADISLSQLDVIGFGRGPGAFTGLRICVSTVQGLAFGADLPVIGVSSLQAMAQAAYQARGVTQVASAIDARMGEVYWGLYQEKNGLMVLLPEQQELVVAPTDLLVDNELLKAQWFATGTGWETYADQLSQHFSGAGLEIEKLSSFPRASAMLPYVLSEFEAGHGIAAELAQPVYLRNNVAKKKAEQGKG